MNAVKCLETFSREAGVTKDYMKTDREGLAETEDEPDHGLLAETEDEPDHGFLAETEDEPVGRAADASVTTGRITYSVQRKHWLRLFRELVPYLAVVLVVLALSLVLLGREAFNQKEAQQQLAEQYGEYDWDEE